MELVETISGKTVDKENCRKMNGMYYLIGDIKTENSGECYFINNKYYKYNTGYIVYDHSVKSYILKSELKDTNFIEEGVINFNEKDEPILGSFSSKYLEHLCRLNYNGSVLYCLNEDIFKNSKLYLENLEDGIYYNRYNLDSYKFVLPAKCNQNYKNTLEYDSRNLTSSAKTKYNELYNPVYHNFLEKDKHDITKGLSFGLEFETVMGFVPQRITDKLGLIPLRDGSITGLEYVTIPLEGKKGFQTVLDTVKELSKRTKYNNDCSLHLHIGNIPRTEEFFIALFKILYILEDEIYSMFPFHKKENYGIKKKHYTKPLPEKETILLLDSSIKTKEDVLRNFNILYTFLSMGQDYKEVGENLKNVKGHPSDPKGVSKWNIKTRYHWVNLIPLLFGNKQTVEFRIHTPTYDVNKIVNYMLTCFSIIDFTIKNQDNILKNFKNYVNINLNHVLFETYYGKCFNDRLLEEIQSYNDYRKKYFFNKTKSGDFLANEKDLNIGTRYINWDKETISEKKLGKYSISSTSAFRDAMNRLDMEAELLQERENRPFIPRHMDVPRPVAVRNNPFRGAIDNNRFFRVERVDPPIPEPIWFDGNINEVPGIYRERGVPQDEVEIEHDDFDFEENDEENNNEN